MKKLLLFLSIALSLIGNAQTSYPPQSTGGYNNTGGTNPNVSTATGVLPVVNGGSGQTIATGTGALVKATSPTIATATLTTPAISSPTVTGHATIEGVTATGATGTGAIVFGTAPTISSATLTASPQLVTPLLGTPTSGVLTNCTGTATGLTVGAVTLNENSSVVLNQALSDTKYTGITISGTAGATLAFGDIVYLAAADSRWELTDADAAATAGDVLVGICVLAAASDGSATTILLQGTIRADANFPALTISAPVYISTTTGDIQVAAPSGTDDVVRRLGFAITADEFYFNPSNDYITVI